MCKVYYGVRTCAYHKDDLSHLGSFRPPSTKSGPSPPVVEDDTCPEPILDTTDIFGKKIRGDPQIILHGAHHELTFERCEVALALNFHERLLLRNGGCGEPPERVERKSTVDPLGRYCEYHEAIREVHRIEAAKKVEKMREKVEEKIVKWRAKVAEAGGGRVGSSTMYNEPSGNRSSGSIYSVGSAKSGGSNEPHSSKNRVCFSRIWTFARKQAVI